MGRPINDISGKYFGNLKVLGINPKRDKKGLYWDLLCSDCGNICYATSSDLNRGRRNFCSECSDERSRITPVRLLYKQYQRNAELRGYSWEISLDRFSEIIYNDCHYCGSSPLQIYYKEGCKESVTYNGIDRVINSIGYKEDNIVPCCKFCNFAKGSGTEEEFLQWIKRLKEN